MRGASRGEGVNFVAWISVIFRREQMLFRMVISKWPVGLVW